MLIPNVGFLNAISVANVQGIASIPTVRLARKLGVLSEGTKVEIRRDKSIALDLDNPYGPGR